MAINPLKISAYHLLCYNIKKTTTGTSVYEGFIKKVMTIGTAVEITGLSERQILYYKKGCVKG